MLGNFIYYFSWWVDSNKIGLYIFQNRNR